VLATGLSLELGAGVDVTGAHAARSPIASAHIAIALLIDI
jgi:hypothetical protein